MINKRTAPGGPDSCSEGKALFQKAEKDIYENITQCLCLAKIQLASVDLHKKEDALARLGEASLLVGKAVQDLRNLAKQLSAFQLKHIA